ncbi:hydantoinase/oxoprolinase family protein [Anaerovorax odorimutans]|uniref:Hydantoinase/oxoprolinase family protein n=1 Tax=Anaerovorax odorimutans TaxID=109327 RepID=A0ABT1RNV1_9FIRM|nr:hydantoinase/oxoprolinase family protein [Anaerovorax odorimutans]MCQ4636873.1 hydantoinase/oxoprolinase family protein [Anaerovorax odorimutans]
MSFILGMDTGGTYTDGVIVDSSKRSIICKAKALTTKEDLTIGIKNCIENLNFDRMEEISLASLSTTLATNAIVEGRGASVGLIYMGTELDEEVPAEISVKVKGRFDIMGHMQEDLDPAEIRQVLSGMKGKVEALAVSGYASVRNPKHEKEIRRLADEILDVPVVCAHQLTSALGFHHRTVTAVLNGRLIPIIDELLKSTKKVLHEKNIYGTVMIVKGDGTLMTEAMAKERPIDTILSGPAASVIGGLALTGRKDGIVLDMGGTTTDIANVSEGSVKIKKEGAKVGGWRTRVRAVEISTFGLGGDSRICLDRKGNVQIGPQKVWPLCVIGKDYPQLVHELQSFKWVGELKTYSQQEADCFMYVNGELPETASPQERKILEKLQGGPHSLTYLARAIGEDPETIDLTPLVESGILARISVTPTDILHVQGRYNQWNRELSRAGVEILARRKEMPVNKFVNMVEKAIHVKMAMTCIQSAADFESEEFSFAESPEAMYLIQAALKERQTSLLNPEIYLRKSIVAIGAPAGAWTCDAGKLLNAEVVVPDNADVANAYGAAVGKVTETVELLISLDGDQYILNTPWERFVYGSKDEAMFYAIHEGRKYIEHQLMDAGCRNWAIEEQPSDIMVETKENEPKVYMGTQMTITGVGSAF